MATESELDNAWTDARLGLLKIIVNKTASDVNSTSTAQVLADVAEAYAWLTRVDQPHGGRAYGGS